MQKRRDEQNIWWGVSPSSSSYLQKWKHRCNYTSPILSWSSDSPLQFPSGTFLICRDRAWPALPSHIKGRPCSLGRFTLLTMIHNRKIRQKRFVHQFEADCKDEMKFWNFRQRLAASTLVPWCTAAKALKMLDRLGCWLSRQTNTISKAEWATDRCW